MALLNAVKPQFSGEWVKLGLCFPYIKNGMNVKQQKGKSGIPITRIETLSGNRFNRDKVGYAGIISTEGIEDRILADGDILMSHINSLPYLGRAVMYEKQDGEQMIHGMNLLRLKADRSTIRPDYAAAYFRSEHFRRQIIRIANKSVNQASFSVRNLKDLSFPLVTLDRQRDIVDRLNVVDNGINALQQILLRFDTLVKSRFIEIFGDCRLARQDQGWKRIGNIGEVLGGATPKTQVEEYWGGGLPWLTPAEIGDSFYVNATSRTLTSEGVRSCSLSKLPAGTVLLSSRAPIGKVAIAGTDMYCNQGFKNIVCGDSVLPRYLYSLLKFNSDYLNSLGRGATFTEISKRIVEDIKIPVPAVELQLQFECFAQQVDKLRFMLLGNPSPTYRGRSFCCSTNSGNGGVILEVKDY